MSERTDPSRQQPFPYVEQNGVRFYGETAGNVEQRDINNLRLPTESTLHVARHLTNISPEAKAKLLGQTINDEGNEIVVDEKFITAQLEAAGSKFHPKINDPEALSLFCQEKLVEALENNQTIIWIKNQTTDEARANIQITVTAADKTRFGLAPEESFGTSSVIKITPDVANKVTQKMRGQGEAKDQVTINTIGDISAPQTNDLVITIIRKSGQTPEFYTAYTGIIAPHLPRAETQSPEELQYNKDWWSQYAFVK
ncbi:MAG: hypothetical protein WC480_03720 [Patescibacteria group bacterium]